MAKDGPGGEKTEKPTAQRLKKARKDGQIARTPELGTWVGVAAASVLMPMLVSRSFTTVQQLFVKVGAVAQHPETSAVSALMSEALTGFLTTLLPTALGLMLAGVAATAAQGGVSVSGKALKPTLKKLNPFKGIKRMFGAQGLWEAIKALIKTAALASVVLVTVGKAKTLVSSAGALPLSSVAGTFADCAVLLMRTVAITGLVIAIADYVIVRNRTMKQLKMSKYEIQQEHKQSEGDPHMKAHRKGLQMAMSRNRMMTDVKEADVLLVNPTHVAVALVQDIPLARALHASCEIGQEVPAQLFTAVARVLAFVMHLTARGVVGGFHRPGFEAPDTEGLPKAGRRRAPVTAT